MRRRAWINSHLHPIFILFFRDNYPLTPSLSNLLYKYPSNPSARGGEVKEREERRTLLFDNAGETPRSPSKPTGVKPRRKTIVEVLPRLHRSHPWLPNPSPESEKTRRFYPVSVFCRFSGEFPGDFPANPGRPRPERDYPCEDLSTLFKTSPSTTAVEARRLPESGHEVEAGEEEEGISRNPTDFEASVRRTPAVLGQTETTLSKTLLVS